MRKIDRSGRTPPWRQIADHLRAEILAGRYSPDGPAVPSANELGRDWGVARRTALKALHSLAEEGLIESEIGMGFFVTRR